MTVSASRVPWLLRHHQDIIRLLLGHNSKRIIQNSNSVLVQNNSVMFFFCSFFCSRHICSCDSLSLHLHDVIFRCKATGWGHLSGEQGRLGKGMWIESCQISHFSVSALLSQWFLIFSSSTAKKQIIIRRMMKLTTHYCDTLPLTTAMRNCAYSHACCTPTLWTVS